LSPPAHEQSSPRGSLPKRIREAERQLTQRRVSAGLRLAAVRRSLRTRLGLPAALLAAAAAGFLLGHHSRRRKRAAPAPDQAPPTGSAAIIGKLLDTLALVKVVTAILAATGRLAGVAGRGRSGGMESRDGAPQGSRDA